MNRHDRAFWYRWDDATKRLRVAKAVASCGCCGGNGEMISDRPRFQRRPPAYVIENQARLLAFIRGFLAEKGYAPSFSEMAEALGLKSKASVYRLVERLDDQGAIQRLPYRARAIEARRR